MVIKLTFFFHLTTFWIELKNTKEVCKQLHHCFKRAKKDEVPCWLNDKKKFANYIFLLHQFELPLSYVVFFNSTSGCALAVNIFTAKIFRITLNGRTLLYSRLSWIFWFRSDGLRIASKIMPHTFWSTKQSNNAQSTEGTQKERKNRADSRQ